MSAKAQAKKDDIIAALVDARQKILDTAASLSAAEQDEVFLGVWSAKDLLAHFVGWDFANIEAVQAILAGEVPGFYVHYDKDWKTFNANLVAQYKTDDFADLLAAVADSHHQLIDVLKNVPAEEFDKDQGIRVRDYKVTIARILQAEARDEGTHYEQIKAFADRDEPTPT